LAASRSSPKVTLAPAGKTPSSRRLRHHPDAGSRDGVCCEREDCAGEDGCQPVSCRDRAGRVEEPGGRAAAYGTVEADRPGRPFLPFRPCSGSSTFSLL